MAQIVAETALNLSSSTILPFNCNSYAEQLRNEFEKMSTPENLAYLNSIDVNLDYLDYAIKNFTRVASEFHNRLNSIDKIKYKIKRKI